MDKFCENCHYTFKATLDGRCPNCESEKWVYILPDTGEVLDYDALEDRDIVRHQYRKFVPLHSPTKKPTLNEIQWDIKMILLNMSSIVEHMNSLYKMRITGSDQEEHAKVFKEEMTRELKRIINQTGVEVEVKEG